MTAEHQRRAARSTKDSLRVLAGPVLAYFDKRFQETYDRIDERLSDRMNELYARVATEVETMSEMTILMQRFVEVTGARIDDAVATISEGRAGGTGELESAFAVAAVGRLPAASRILHVGRPESTGGLPETLEALGYRVVRLDPADGAVTAGGPDPFFDCVLWLSAEPDAHTVELLGKSLEPGRELVMTLRPRDGESFVDEGLAGWSVVEHRRLARSEAGWAPASVPGGADLELVRATPLA